MVDATTRLGETWLRERLSGFLEVRSPWLTELRSLFATFDSRVEAFLIGGCLRDLALHGTEARPRDIDIVFTGPTDEVTAAVAPYLQRKTRFGGLQLAIGGTEVDLWPLSSTWAFDRMGLRAPSFADLPRTTFLDIEAIVAELPLGTSSRSRIYSHGFFQSVESRTIELNFEENPYPALCLSRALDLASRLDFSIGPRLSRFVSEWFGRLSEDELTAAHHATHGTANCPSCLFRAWRRAIRETSPGSPVAPPENRPRSGTS